MIALSLSLTLSSRLNVWCCIIRVSLKFDALKKTWLEFTVIRGNLLCARFSVHRIVWLTQFSSFPIITYTIDSTINSLHNLPEMCINVNSMNFYVHPVRIWWHIYVWREQIRKHSHVHASNVSTAVKCVLVIIQVLRALISLLSYRFTTHAERGLLQTKPTATRWMRMRVVARS